MTDHTDRLAAFRAGLIEHREKSELNPAEAARRAGISPQRWRAIEQGYETRRDRETGDEVRIGANPRRDNILRMARAVSWPLDEALSAAGEKPLAPAEEHRIMPGLRGKLEKILDRASDGEMAVILQVAAAVVDRDFTLPVGSGNPGDLVTIQSVVPGSGAEAERLRRESERRPRPVED